MCQVANYAPWSSASFPLDACHNLLVLPLDKEERVYFGYTALLKGDLMREKTSQALMALAVSAGATLVGRTLGQDSTLALLSEGYTFIPKRC